MHAGEMLDYEQQIPTNANVHYAVDESGRGRVFRRPKPGLFYGTFQNFQSVGDLQVLASRNGLNSFRDRDRFVRQRLWVSFYFVPWDFVRVLLCV